MDEVKLVPTSAAIKPEVVEEVKCDHLFKLDSHGFRKTEYYKCVKCGNEKTHRYYD